VVDAAVGQVQTHLVGIIGQVPALRERHPLDTTISLIDIDDCARGHLLAADRGVSGQRYLLSGPVLTVREGVRSMNQMLGRHDRPWFVKREAVELAAPMLGALFAAIGRQPLLCTESARVLLSGHRYDGSKAERDLGIEYTPLMETLDRTINWFRQEGFLD
jgi:dihydroflavonol-4-reductase